MTPEARAILAELHAEFAEADAEGASSNDIVQMLDDFLSRHDFPSVLYSGGAR